MVAGTPGPKWASWSYKNQHLSAYFHSSTKAFEDFIKWLKMMPYCTEGMVAYPQSKVLTVCLGIGLVLHDLHAVQFEVEGNEDSSMLDPSKEHLQRSKLKWAHTQVLLQTCHTIARDLKECFDDGKKGEPVAAAGSERKKPPSKKQKKIPERYECLMIVRPMSKLIYSSNRVTRSSRKRVL
jgi:hypothetical protein